MIPKCIYLCYTFYTIRFFSRNDTEHYAIAGLCEKQNKKNGRAEKKLCLLSAFPKLFFSRSSVLVSLWMNLLTTERIQG